MSDSTEQPQALADFELKLAWVKHQFEVFEDQVRIWRDTGGYGIVFKPQPDRVRQDMHLHASEPPPALPLLIGDALFGMRSGVDHLAYALAEAESAPLDPDAAESVEFPIFGNRAMTAAERARKIGRLPADAQAIIEELQPNVRAKDELAADPLWRLHELARIDRHRLLHVVAVQMTSFGIGGDNLHIEGMVIDGVGPDAVDGTKLGWCAVRPINPGRPMQMNVSPEPSILFEGGIAAGLPVLDVLREIHGHINDEVVERLRRFL